MKYYIYSLYDRIVGAYGVPQFSNNDPDTTVETYRRMIVTQREPAKLEQIKDLQLCLLGCWDDTAGKFSAIEPKVLANLGAFVPVIREVHSDANGKEQREEVRS